MLSASTAASTGFDLRRRLVGGGGWALGGSAAETLIGLVENALLARILLPANLGAYYLVLSVVVVASTIGQLGLAQTVVRLLAGALARDDTARAQTVVRRVLGYGCLGALSVGVFLAAGPGEWITAHLFDEPALAGLMKLAAVWASLNALRTLVAETFRGMHDIRLASLFAKASSGLVSVAFYTTLLIMRGQVGLRLVLILCVASAAISVVLALVVLRGKMRHYSREHPAGRDRVLASALPLLVNGLVAQAFTTANLWILGATSESGSVALYGAAVRLSSLALLPLVIVNAVLAPIVAGMHVRERKIELERLLRAAAGVALVPGALFGLAILLFGDRILAFVFGEFFTGAAVALLIMVAGQVVSLAAGSCGITLIMTGHERLRVQITVVVAVVSISLGLVITPRYGLVGAATNLAVGQALQNLLTWLAVRMKLGIQTHAGLTGFRELARLRSANPDA